MTSLEEAFNQVRHVLRLRLGKDKGYPAPGTPHAAVAVLLGESLGPAQVAKAMEVLKEAGLLERGALGATSEAEIDEVLKAGKVALNSRLQVLLHRLGELLTALEPEPDSIPTNLLRERLRGISGIGPAAAEAIMLHAFQREAFPVRRSSFRVLFRHGWVDPETTEEEARELVTGSAGGDVEALALVADHLEEVAKRWCKLARPACQGCPLESLLPENGPREPDA